MLSYFFVCEMCSFPPFQITVGSNQTSTGNQNRKDDGIIGRNEHEEDKKDEWWVHRLDYEGMKAQTVEWREVKWTTVNH